MRLPKKVDILGVSYQICLRVNPRLEGDPVHGYCDFENKKIIIDRNLSKALKIETYYHECFHGVLFESGLGLSDSKLFDRYEERPVIQLSRWIAKELMK